MTPEDSKTLPSLHPNIFTPLHLSTLAPQLRHLLISKNSSNYKLLIKAFTNGEISKDGSGFIWKSQKMGIK